MHVWPRAEYVLLSGAQSLFSMDAAYVLLTVAVALLLLAAHAYWRKKYIERLLEEQERSGGEGRRRTPLLLQVKALRSYKDCKMSMQMRVSVRDGNDVATLID